MDEHDVARERILIGESTQLRERIRQLLHQRPSVFLAGMAFGCTAQIVFLALAFEIWQ